MNDRGRPATSARISRLPGEHGVAAVKSDHGSPPFESLGRSAAHIRTEMTEMPLIRPLLSAAA